MIIDDLLAAIERPEITAADIIAASELARKYLDPRYQNILYAEREQVELPERRQSEPEDSDE